MEHVLISSMKDEGPFVLEWVAHHRLMGFDRICVASNDCRDGADVLLAALGRAGAIVHVPNVLTGGQMPQHAAYALMRREHDIDRADWLMVLDADEFLLVTAGQGRVQDLTAAAPEHVDIIALNAAHFGTDAGPWAPGRVCDRFRLRLPLNHPANGMVKSITRNPARFTAIHNHSPAGFRTSVPCRVMRADGSQFEVAPGAPLWKRLRNFHPAMICHELARFNHYAIKSRQDFTLRALRSLGTARRADEPNLRHDGAYFSRLAAANLEDTAILRHAADVQAEMDRLMALPGVRAAQTAAEAAYGAMIAALPMGVVARLTQA